MSKEKRTAIEHSKIGYILDDLTSESVQTWSNIVQTGALQRIAGSLERIAHNYTHLINERDKYKQWYAEEYQKTAYLKRCNRSLRGHITRLKRKINERR